jgi:glycosyltransferase involved in cell wall biosynthesis
MPEPSVIHVLWSGGAGGIERLVHDLALCQRELGSTVTIAFGQESGRFARSVREADLPVVDLGLRSGFDAHPQRLRAAIGAFRGSDLVHLHGFNVPLAISASRSGRPIVFTDHGNAALGRPIRWTDRVKGRLQRLFLNRSCAAIAANSAWTAARLTERCRIRAERIEVICNGIAFDEAVRPRPTEPQGRLVLAFVGRLAGVKRVDRLLKAVALMREEARPQVLIVGEGPNGAELRALAARERLQTVEFLGTRSDVPEILARADVLVLPSQAEAFGLVVLEACDAGALPIVFADGGGAREALPPSGLIVSDARELAAALSELEPGRGRLDEGAQVERRAWAREHFAVERTARAYLRCYERVLSGHALNGYAGGAGR